MLLMSIVGIFFSFSNRCCSGFIVRTAFAVRQELNRKTSLYYNVTDKPRRPRADRTLSGYFDSSFGEEFLKSGWLSWIEFSYNIFNQLVMMVHKTMVVAITLLQNLGA